MTAVRPTGIQRCQLLASLRSILSGDLPTPRPRTVMHPSFIEVLRQLAPDDARLLDKPYDACKLKNTRRVRPWVDSISIAEQTRRQAPGENPEDAFANLVRLGLIQASYEMIDRPTALKIVGEHPQIIGRSELKEESELSEVAFKFVQACRAPNPQIPIDHLTTIALM